MLRPGILDLLLISILSIKCNTCIFVHPPTKNLLLKSFLIESYSSNSVLFSFSYSSLLLYSTVSSKYLLFHFVFSHLHIFQYIHISRALNLLLCFSSSSMPPPSVNRYTDYIYWLNIQSINFVDSFSDCLMFVWLCVNILRLPE